MYSYRGLKFYWESEHGETSNPQQVRKGMKNSDFSLKDF